MPSEKKSLTRENYWGPIGSNKKLNDSKKKNYKSYYKYKPGMTIEEIAELYVEEYLCAYDTVMWFDPKDVFKYREYDRDVSDQDEMREWIRSGGWGEDNPAWIAIDRQGKILLIEGNHRTKIAVQEGIEKIPVRISWRDEL